MKTRRITATVSEKVHAWISSEAIRQHRTVGGQAAMLLTNIATLRERSTPWTDKLKLKEIGPGL